MKSLYELLQYFMFYSILFFFLQYGDNIKPELKSPYISDILLQAAIA